MDHCCLFTYLFFAEEDGCDQEYQQWHKEALDALTKIEVEFARLRDKYVFYHVSAREENGHSHNPFYQNVSRENVRIE